LVVIAKILQKWLKQRTIKTLYIDPGSPWQNGHIEFFNASDALIGKLSSVLPKPEC